MARLLWRLLTVTLVCAACVVASRVYGSAQSGGGQLAFSFIDQSRGGSTTLLLDTRTGARYQLWRRDSNVEFIGWIDSQRMIVGAYNRRQPPSLFTLGKGWRDDLNLDEWQILDSHYSSSRGWAGSSDGDLSPLLSPDGARLALMRRVGNSFFLRLYVLDHNGNLRRLTRGVLDLNYAWRPCPEAGC
jgi:hypothetical protein